MKILVLANDQGGLLLFRKELLEELIQKKEKIYISVPEGDNEKEIEEIGCKEIVNKYIDRRGTNPVQEIKLFCYYKNLINIVKPDVVLTFTIKPNVYGGIVCTLLRVPYISNITGLGTSIENKGFLRFFILLLYKAGLRNAKTIFLQNKENYSYMLSHHLVRKEQCKIIPGSGVNISKHCYEPYPRSEKTVFTTIGRIMKDKGINELLEAAEIIKKKYPDTVFRLIGGFDEAYQDKVKQFQNKGIIKYLGIQKDVHPFITESHAIIHASYHEGMSNVLLEAAATGRPVIATDVSGCIETFDPDLTGISFQAKSVSGLVNAIETFMSLSYEQRETMGKAGREKMVREFDRRIVVKKYMREINRISEGKRCLQNYMKK